MGLNSTLKHFLAKLRWRELNKISDFISYLRYWDVFFELSFNQSDINFYQMVIKAKVSFISPSVIRDFSTVSHVHLFLSFLMLVIIFNKQTRLTIRGLTISKKQKSTYITYFIKLHRKIQFLFSFMTFFIKCNVLNRFYESFSSNWNNKYQYISRLEVVSSLFRLCCWTANCFLINIT